MPRASLRCVSQAECARPYAVCARCAGTGARKEIIYLTMQQRPEPYLISGITSIKIGDHEKVCERTGEMIQGRHFTH